MTVSVIISSLISGLLGAMGFGGGSVLIIYLTLFLSLPQKEAQGINLFFFLCVNAFSLIKHAKSKLINFKQALLFLPLGITGLIIGYVLLDKIPSESLSKYFGVMLLILGIKELLGDLITKKLPKKGA